MRYVIASVKQSEVFEGSIEGAIERAKEIDADMQPAYGVYVAHEGAQCKEDVLWELEGDWSLAEWTKKEVN